MKISRDKIYTIVKEELEKALQDEGILKHLGKTVAPFALGATIATSVSDKEPQKPSEEPVATVAEPQDKKVYKPELQLPSRYGILKVLGDELSGLDSDFNLDSERGRAALAIALAIGGTETYGSLKDKKDFYTLMGGGKRVNNRMKGFAQFDTRYHKDKIDTPRKYAGYLADIIGGRSRLPNGRRGVDAATGLVNAIRDGKVKGEKDFIKWLKDNRFGGSNWQGIDDGWGRVPGLGTALLKFIKEPTRVEV